MSEHDWLTSTDPGAMLAFLMAGPGDVPTRASRLPGASDRKLRLWACACVRQVWRLLVDEWSRQAVEVAERYADGEAALVDLRVAGHAANAAWLDIGANAANSLAAHEAWRNCDDAAVEGVNFLLDEPPAPGRTRQQEAALLREIAGNPWRPVKLPTIEQPETRCRRCGCTRCTHDDDHCRCDDCGSEDWYTPPIPTPWYRDPAVLTLARAAYAERPGRECAKCHGKGRWWHCNGCQGEWAGDVGPDCFVCGHPYLTGTSCPDCRGTGRIDDGTLDPLRLAILADALEEAGCTDEDVLRHLRGAVHVRGCWVVDLVLGKE